ncbi:MAG: serine/threonine protein kinase [Planctomycetes bacterium]|nr:serine/threonine protein kinase [Planctomycetota bacterium]
MEPRPQAGRGRGDRLAEVFDRALNLIGPERNAFLDAECGDDASLRAELDSMMCLFSEAANFMESEGVNPAREKRTEMPLIREGNIIGQYQLLSVIGEGGFGTVFRAQQLQPVRRLVALKIIKLGMDTREVIARFEVERQALAMMDHPAIARVFDAGATESGHPYFVMEFVEGTPITEFCDAQKLSIRERLKLFIHLCQAVQHAHQKGVIHRDIKSSNVLVTMQDAHPAPKVIDFGIAKATNPEQMERTVFTQLRQIIGTPTYMSPEQAGATSGDVDTRSDIYSLGVLLYELLAGTTPFDAKRLLGAGFDEMRRIIREEEPVKPSNRLPTSGDAETQIAAQRHTDARRLRTLLRGDLDWIAMKCLEKDRTLRYVSVSALAEDIQRYLNNEPVIAGPRAPPTDSASLLAVIATSSSRERR